LGYIHMAGHAEKIAIAVDVANYDEAQATVDACHFPVPSERLDELTALLRESAAGPRRQPLMVIVRMHDPAQLIGVAVLLNEPQPIVELHPRPGAPTRHQVQCAWLRTYPLTAAKAGASWDDVWRCPAWTRLSDFVVSDVLPKFGL
jgi:hypothetical protein